MLSKLYKNLILSNPKTVFILLIITLISFGPTYGVNNYGQYDSCVATTCPFLAHMTAALLPLAHSWLT